MILSAVSTLIGAVGSVAPSFLLPYLGIGLSALFPALLALPVGATAAAAVRRQGAEDHDRAVAAAAGAGMGTALVCAGAVAAQTLATGDVFPIPFLLTGAALAVGTVGSMAFAAVPASRGRRAHVPSLYAGLMAAGLGGPALLVGGALWAGVAWMFPFLSPWALTPSFLPGTLAGATAATLSMVGLAPISYLSARAGRRAFPGAGPRALGLGLLAPPVAPFVAVAGALIFQYLALPTTIAAAAVGGTLALAAHALAVGLGLRAEARRQGAPRRLSAGS